MEKRSLHGPHRATINISERRCLLHLESRSAGREIERWQRRNALLVGSLGRGSHPATPATIVPDKQGKNPKPPMFQGVSEKYVLTDGKQTIEVYPTGGDTHTKEYTLIYLPGPKILVEADAFSPGPPDAAPPATPPPNAVTLYDDIQRLKLNVATIAPIHGRGAVPIAELRTFIGKKGG